VAVLTGDRLGTATSRLGLLRLGARTSFVPASTTVPPGAQAVTWTFAVGPNTGLPNWALTQAHSRRVTWRLTTPSDCTFDVDGESQDALQIAELVTDVWIYRNGVALFRGRVGTTSDNYDGNVLKTTVNVADYKGVLARRLLLEGDTLAYTTATDQAAIALGLINSTQRHAGGQMGIVTGVGASTGVTRVRTFQAGQNVGEELDKLSNVINGFEWDISPTKTTALHLDIYSPTRGATTSAVLDVGGRVRSFQRQYDPGLYANAVRVTGANTTGGAAPGLTAVNRASSNIGAAAQGRWDSQVGDTNIVEQVTLNERAGAELAESSTVLPQWTVELQPNSWDGPGDVWLGDTVTLIGKIGRLNDVGPLRVQEVSCAFDDDDTVTTTITLGQVPLSRRFRLRTFSQRLSALERR